VTQIKAWLFLFGLLTLCGCSPTSLRFPWQATDKQNQEMPLAVGKDDVSKNLPLIVEIVDSGLIPVNKDDLGACSKKLAMPLEQLAPAHPSNYGERDARDAWGRPLKASPELIVLHETVISGPQTVAFFQTNHPEDENQASYHLLIDRDGSRLRIVPDGKRAYGAGMSAFGDFTQRIKPTSVGSINNIALHVSLVSPADGRDDRDGHSGYTDAQYKTLAGQVLLWQAAFGIPMTRVTTHAVVDRSHSRYDPRSFRWNRFDPHYRAAVAACGFSQFDNQQAGL
jgi:N-acetyl-anhydromuramyl-L-alanine amidase AmpD